MIYLLAFGLLQLSGASLVAPNVNCLTAAYPPTIPFFDEKTDQYTLDKSGHLELTCPDKIFEDGYVHIRSKDFQPGQSFELVGDDDIPRFRMTILRDGIRVDKKQLSPEQDFSEGKTWLYEKRCEDIRVVIRPDTFDIYLNQEPFHAYPRRGSINQTDLIQPPTVYGIQGVQVHPGLDPFGWHIGETAQIAKVRFTNVSLTHFHCGKPKRLPFFYPTDHKTLTMDSRRGLNISVERIDIAAAIHGNTFDVSLCTEGGRQCPFHMKINKNKDEVQFSTSGFWKDFDKFQKGVPIKKGNIFDLTIVIYECHFNVYINHKEYTWFKHDHPKQSAYIIIIPLSMVDTLPQILSVEVQGSVFPRRNTPADMKK